MTAGLAVGAAGTPTPTGEFYVDISVANPGGSYGEWMLEHRRLLERAAAPSVAASARSPSTAGPTSRSSVRPSATAASACRTRSSPDSRPCRRSGPPSRSARVVCWSGYPPWVRAGARKLDLLVEGVTYSSSTARVEKRLDGLDGVGHGRLRHRTASVLSPTGVAAGDLVAEVRAAGYGARLPARGPGAHHRQEGRRAAARP